MTRPDDLPAEDERREDPGDSHCQWRDTAQRCSQGSKESSSAPKGLLDTEKQTLD